MRIPSLVTSEVVSRGASLESVEEEAAEAAAGLSLDGGGEEEVGAAGLGDAAERFETGFVLAIWNARSETVKADR